jgi:glycine oxidase
MKVAIIGCGVVGAAIAYCLSQIQGLEITVWDSRSPAQWEATGAALGVLMAVMSPKFKGKHVKLRLQSLRLYETLIPELEAVTGQIIPYNRKGILQLCFEETRLERWHATVAIREKQGFRLEVWPRSQLITAYPELISSSLAQTLAVGAIYSPEDRQLHPILLTQAFIQGAQQQGVQFYWNTPITQLNCVANQVTHLQTQTEKIALDYLIVSAGLGSVTFTQQLHHSLQLSPVLGQALHLKLPTSLPQDWPVVNGEDVHLVPLNTTELWVGATVEPPVSNLLHPANADSAKLQDVFSRAIALYPPLAEAEVLHTWQGLRPRPCDRAAPVIEVSTQFQNVMLATGHYRNGVLLAPITAQKVREWIEGM